MEFLKKHYEKILLGVVLLAVAVAAGFLPIKITSEKQKLTDLNLQKKNPKAAPLTNLDLTISDKAIALANESIAEAVYQGVGKRAGIVHHDAFVKVHHRLGRRLPGKERPATSFA